MPNGRLSKCVLAGRKSADLYQNTSGNAASVSLFANAISTNTNSEMTVVVGIASTTLAAKTTKISASAGTFCSMSAPHYYTGGSDVAVTIGAASTYVGFSVPPTEEYVQGHSNLSPGVAGADHLQTASFPVYVDTYGCRTNEFPDANYEVSSLWVCQCSNACIMGKLYGGNEIQNPAIWMREYPTFCHACCGGDYLWAHKFVGVIYNCCCACCTAPCTRCAGTAGTWYPINARQVGMGNSANARQNALQKMINWCCCCGYIGDHTTNDGMNPIVCFSGISQSHGCKCRWGTWCNFQMCRMCACHCCAGGGYKMWNWYALDRDFQCCCENFTTNDYACWKRKDAPALDPGSQCFSLIETGKMRTPLWFNFMWCCNCACGCTIMGHITTRYNFCQDACGCICWQHWQDLQVSSCHNRANWLCQNTKCFCRPWDWEFMRQINTNLQYRMSPHGFAFGMTNCAMMTYAGWGGAGDNPCCHRYLISYPDICYMRCCQPVGECYFYQRYRLDIHVPPAGSNQCYEFPVKYLAWNCFVTNKHDAPGCNYLMIRSMTASHCGVFTFDADDMRKSHGPFCGCSTQSDHCCGTIVNQRCFLPDTGDAGGATGLGAKLTKVADFPTEMASVQYANGNDCIMCTSCLFRADFCTWTMSLWNYVCQRWDGFQTNNLKDWSKVTDPYSVKVSNVLSTTVTSDYACIVDDCNCYFANIDCTGIIDYKLSVNQYERTGIVLSDGDRLMINNDADVCLNFQVWGYEG